jgi:hypothetical protein
LAGKKPIVGVAWFSLETTADADEAFTPSR